MAQQLPIKIENSSDFEENIKNEKMDPIAIFEFKYLKNRTSTTLEILDDGIGGYEKYT